MKQLLILLLMVTIQLTFMQKVIASVPVLKSDSQSQQVVHCDMGNMKMSALDCAMQMKAMNGMEHCDSSCEMMTVVSVLHFIENVEALTLSYTQLSYPTLTTNTANAHPTSLYRPPLFS